MRSPATWTCFNWTTTWVEIGGEIRARGVNSKNIPWRIGIEQPVGGQDGVRKIIKLENIAMATSGDYRNYFEHEGTRYSHTIDPRSGRPVSHGLASVTVLHPSTMLADAWATGLLVLGPERGLELARQNGLAAYFIIHNDAGFREESTPAFNPILSVTELKMSNPTCTIIAGPNGAGKTTFALEYLPLIDCRIFLNADMIAAGLAPFSAEKKRLEAGKLFLQEIERSMEKREDFAFETTLSGKSHLSRVRRMLEDVGASISFISGCPVWKHH